jgi:hypothetical protein
MPLFPLVIPFQRKVVYLFGVRRSRLRTRRLCRSTRNNGDTTSLYLFGPPESKTVRPILGVDCLRIADVTRGRPTRLILASRQGRLPRLLVGYDHET